RLRSAATSAPVVVDLPTPGGPVRPMIRARPAAGASPAMISRSSGAAFSTRETARATARRSPRSTRSTIPVASNVPVTCHLSTGRPAPAAGPLRPSTQYPGPAADLLPEDVGVAGVPGRLLHHVHQDPAQRHPAQLRVGHRVVQREAGRRPARLGAGPPVLRGEPGHGA